MLRVSIRKQFLSKLAQVAPIIKTEPLLNDDFITATIDTDMTREAFWKMWNNS